MLNVDYIMLNCQISLTNQTPKGKIVVFLNNIERFINLKYTIDNIQSVSDFTLNKFY